MEFLYVDSELPHEMVGELLAQVFPLRKAIHWDSLPEPNEQLYQSDEFLIYNTEFDPDKLEFGCTVSVYRTPDENAQERALYLARLLAVRLGRRVLVPFTHPHNEFNPFFNIIFDSGRSFLADDNNTNFAGDTEGKVKILEEYPLPHYQFDGLGKFIC